MDVSNVSMVIIWDGKHFWVKVVVYSGVKISGKFADKVSEFGELKSNPNIFVSDVPRSPGDIHSEEFKVAQMLPF